jgi:hypothetical protein
MFCIIPPTDTQDRGPPIKEWLSEGTYNEIAENNGYCKPNASINNRVETLSLGSITLEEP